MRCPRPDALLARIAALDAQLNAFLLPTPEKAREQACAAEREILYRRGEAGAGFGCRGAPHLGRRLVLAQSFTGRNGLALVGRYGRHSPLLGVRRRTDLAEYGFRSVMS